MGDTPPEHHWTLSLLIGESGDWLLLLGENAPVPPVAVWPLSRPSQPKPAPVFSQASSTSYQPPMEELEAPTRPATPRNISAEDLYWESAIGDDLPISRQPLTPVPGPNLPRSKASFPVLRERNIITAGVSKCAVCYRKFKGRFAEVRVEHFNACWDKIRKAASQSIGSRKDLVPSRVTQKTQSAAAISLTGTSVLLGPCILCNLPLKDLYPIDAFQHRIDCQRALNTPPTACPCCNASLATDDTPWDIAKIAEHIYTCSVPESADNFRTMQKAWLDRRETHKNPANCALCTKDLKNLDDIDAFHHRRTCAEKLKPVQCPVCFDPLPDIEPGGTWTVERLLWHLHSCQHDDALSAIDRDNFDILDARCKGRTQGCWIMFSKNSGSMIGPRKGWSSRDHQRSFRSKTFSGRKNETGSYLVGNSKLRALDESDAAIAVQESPPSPWNTSTTPSGSIDGEERGHMYDDDATSSDIGHLDS